MNKSNKQKALEYFINQGLSPHAASGLVGTLLSESSLLPDSVNPSSGAYGIAQWLGPRKRELFKRYGNKPTLENQLEFVWHELGTTHKNGGQRLLTAKTPEEAADIAFGYYEFMNGPEGAVMEMNKHGQNGAASRAQKRKYARGTYDVFYGPHARVSPIEPNLRPATRSVTQSPKMQLAPISLQQPTQIQYNKTLPDTEVIGRRRKALQAPTIASLWDTQKQAIEYNLLKAAGMIPEDNDDDYMNTFVRPRLNIPQYDTF